MGASTVPARRYGRDEHGGSEQCVTTACAQCWAAPLLHGEGRCGAAAAPTKGRRFRSNTESLCTRLTTHKK